MDVYKLAHSGKDLDDAVAGRFTTEVLNVAENGSYTPGEGVDGFSKVSVDVQPPLEERVITKPGSYTPSEGLYGFSRVTVDVMDEQAYIEAVAAATWPSGDITVSGESIGDYAFCKKKITSISAPNGTSIGSNAFKDCDALTEIKLPNVVSISSNAFNDCDALTEIKLPNVVSISSNAFEKCSALTVVALPNAKKLGNNVFSNCTALETLNLPAFSGPVGTSDNLCESCTSLKTVFMPEATNLHTFGYFRNCTNLEEVWTPKATGNPQYHMCNCKKLRFWDAGFMTGLTSYAVIQNTASLETLILRSTKVVPINFSVSGGSTLHPDYTGDVVCTVYVPQTLVEAYKTATNWVALYDAGRCNFVALEGSEYE